MRTKAIVAAAVVIPLLFTAFIFSIPRKPAQDITVRHVKSVQSGDWVAATFEMTNHTTSRYFAYPVSVEVRNGLVWKECFEFNSYPRSFLGPHGSQSPTFDMTNLPTGSPLRLRMCAVKDLASLQSSNILGQFLIRLNLRFREGQENVPLNPLDHGVIALSSKPIQIVSEEFVEPEPEPTSKANSGK